MRRRRFVSPLKCRYLRSLQKQTRQAQQKEAAARFPATGEIRGLGGLDLAAAKSSTVSA